MGNGSFFIWSAFGANTAICISFMAIAVLTLDNLVELRRRLTGDLNSVQQATVNGLLASCILGFVTVCLFCVIAFLLLLGKCFNTRGQAGYGYLLGASLHTSMVLLLAGLVLQANAEWMGRVKDVGVWSSRSYQLYQACYALCYALTGTFLLNFLVCVLARNHFVVDAPVASVALPQSLVNTFKGRRGSGGSRL